MRKPEGAVYKAFGGAECTAEGVYGGIGDRLGRDCLSGSDGSLVFQFLDGNEVAVWEG